jgi:group I intron endonuclease
MKKRIQGIYQIRNIINGNSYIGQSVDIKYRWYTHKSFPKKSYEYPIYRAFRKYGIKNFEFKILEYVDNIDDLTNREQYWYDKLEPIYNQMKPIEHISKNIEVRVCKIDIDTLNIMSSEVTQTKTRRKLC